jgi:hypothetical protein
MSEKAGRTEGQSDYQSYLLRLWRAKEGEEGWRASLESAQTGERKGFATLDALFGYVRSQTLLESIPCSCAEGAGRTRGRKGGDELATR